jgi:hypothetical protein
MNALEKIGAVALAVLIIVPIGLMQSLFLLLGWWLCHDFLRMPMLGFWEAWGMCIVANVLVKSQLTK